jgi:hypothetical protein
MGRLLGLLIIFGSFFMAVKLGSSGIPMPVAFGIGGFFALLGLFLFRAGASQAKKHQYSIYCAKCDQFLGRGDRFDSPCPRCGSNRYSSTKD